jgi:hypothetical protein
LTPSTLLERTKSGEYLLAERIEMSKQPTSLFGTKAIESYLDNIGELTGTLDTSEDFVRRFTADRDTDLPLVHTRDLDSEELRFITKLSDAIKHAMTPIAAAATIKVCPLCFTAIAVRAHATAIG